MNKNYGIFFPFNGETAVGILKCKDMNEKLLKFFMYIAQRCDDNKYLASVRQDKALLHYGISRATYYNRINKLMDLGLLKKIGRGVYEVNLRYAKVISKKDKDLAAAINQFAV